MSEYLTRAFHAHEGSLRLLLGESYEPRRQQAQMALAVDGAFCTGSGLVVEAPCGSGKSLAYLIPAAYHAMAHAQQAVVATAHIALQEQLFGKDLPLVARALRSEGNLSFALFKGKANYLCPLQADLMRRASLSFEFANEGVEEARRVLAWADTTETGDKSELDFTPSSSVWAKFCVGAEECLGHRCRYVHAGTCYVMRARAAAAKAHVIVTNHHQLINDVLADRQVLPPYKHLIVDEGHELVHVAREVLGFSFTAGRVRRLITWLERLNKHEHSKRLRKAARALFEGAEEFCRSKAYAIRLKRPLPPTVPADALLAVLTEVEAAAQSVGASSQEHHGTAAIAGELAIRLGAELATFANMSEPKEMVYWIQDHEGKDCSLESRSLDPAPVLRRKLFGEAAAYVITSATLSVEGSCAFVRRATGIPSDAKELVLSSPFDFERNARFAILGGTVPADPKFTEHVTRELLHIIQVAPGGVLALFTAWHNMLSVVRKLRQEMTSNVRLLVQGDAPRTRLIEEFRELKNSVLCGVASFWQGVDVPGEALVAVVMDKLPFPAPTEPLVDAIHAQLGRNAFMQYDLPIACIRVQQGAGRLIRSASDYGAIILLDDRVVTKGYGTRILKSLPPMPIIRTREEVREFFETVRGQRNAK